MCNPPYFKSGKTKEKIELKTGAQVNKILDDLKGADYVVTEVKKSVKSKGKTVPKWYCYWNDPVTGVLHQKVCKGCKTQAEAYAFVSALPPIFVEGKITIAKIAE